MSLSSFFAGVEGWFKKEESSVAKVLNRVEPIIKEAEPIVLKIAAVASQVATAELPGGAMLTAIEGYLATAVKDSTAIAAFSANNANTSIANLLHNAAVAAVKVLPVADGAVVSDIDTAVQLAYSVIKEQSATPVDAPVVIIGA
jgi:hypothetical protein